MKSRNNSDALIEEQFKCNCGFSGALESLVFVNRTEFFYQNGNKEIAQYPEWFCPKCETELYNDFGR